MQPGLGQKPRRVRGRPTYDPDDEWFAPRAVVGRVGSAALSTLVLVLVASSMYLLLLPLELTAQCRTGPPDLSESSTIAVLLTVISAPVCAAVFAVSARYQSLASIGVATGLAALIGLGTFFATFVITITFPTPALLSPCGMDPHSSIGVGLLCLTPPIATLAGALLFSWRRLLVGVRALAGTAAVAALWIPYFAILRPITW